MDYHATHLGLKQDGKHHDYYHDDDGRGGHFTPPLAGATSILVGCPICDHHYYWECRVLLLDTFI